MRTHSVLVSEGKTAPKSDNILWLARIGRIFSNFGAMQVDGAHVQFGNIPMQFYNIRMQFYNIRMQLDGVQVQLGNIRM
jgi:hypothetical protein